MRRSILLDGFSENDDSTSRNLKKESYFDQVVDIDLECEISSSIMNLVQDRTRNLFDFVIRWFINLVFWYLQFFLQYSHSHHHTATQTYRLDLTARYPKRKEIVVTGSRLSAWVIEEVLWGLHIQYPTQETHCVCCSIPETIRRLGKILGESQYHKNVISLIFSGHCAKNCTSVEFRPLFDSVATNNTLKLLDISGLQVNFTSSESLVKCLQRNHTLQTLKMTDCGLSVKSMTLLLENLGSYFGLRRLYLDGFQKHGPSGHEEVVDIAIRGLKRRNSTLEALFLPPSFDSFRSELDLLLDGNLGGRRIMLRYDEPSDSRQYPIAVWSHVLERINTVELPNGYQQTERKRAARRADMIYLMLRQHFLLEA